ncbi:nucleoside diphosphate kinase 6 [Acyrthosiphon pisum]|uniref:Nucleoside diphosphate kinase-like domain-containing protein n=1 Tax=Acyrthosiphon pisum TaxID=7029 RepID=A0A8R2F8G0_ACYPI|nr:nucleoside diphosphate kinase 6 [Acyrthosiphon pisum]XP_008183412.1 nucleoside diphosphate kinase 6 [Acyrthosiphon pisum]XP_016660124.1 nucleoside diphosphate kinase 6 [Acyrthosiphon pisum]|eukprot:XP_001944771.1 PREDICTED: nucleoside diphosphate kinase 6 [Acyrthosiphon pisum]
MTSVKHLQLTLAIMKPHVVSSPFSLHDIRRTILDNGFYVVRSKRQTIKLEQAEQFYREHKTKFFYNRLITFMTSGPSEAYILAREDAISVWRRLMGPTKVFQCQLSNPDSIRAKHGLTDTRNATHGSDSDESVRKEVSIMVPQFCFDHWKQIEEPMFRNGRVQFNDKQFLHSAHES